MIRRQVLVTVSLSLLAGVGALALATMALPRHVQVQRSALIAAEPAVVHALVASTAGFQRFNPFLAADPGLAIRPTGPAKGVGAGFAWAGREGSGSQTIVADEASRVVMQLELGAMGRPVQSFLFEPTAGGTRVVWQLDADLGLNPAARMAGLLVDGMLGPRYEEGLHLLARAANERALAQRAP